MLEQSLRFVQGAVATKDFVPELTHFLIRDGLVKGYNGRIALCSPIDVDLNVTPKAVQFANALQKAQGTIKLHVTNAGRLAVSADNVRVYVDCLPGDTFPEALPTGERYSLEGTELLPAIRALIPFVAKDASRPWARGILFRDRSAYATNNVVLVEHWLGEAIPQPVNIPIDALRELVRIGEEPQYMLVDDKSISFVYEDEQRWLRSQLYALNWPDVAAILEADRNPRPVGNNFAEALDTLSSFTDDADRVYLNGDTVSTTNEEGEGAHADVPGLEGSGVYNCTQLRAVMALEPDIDFDMYPGPVPFETETMRGVIIGMRQ